MSSNAQVVKSWLRNQSDESDDGLLFTDSDELFFIGSGEDCFYKIGTTDREGKKHVLDDEVYVGLLSTHIDIERLTGIIDLRKRTNSSK